MAESQAAAPQIEWRDLESLVPYARNARTHSDEQVAQIAASMVEFGFTNPVLIDAQGGIVAGHGRVLAARRAWEAGKEIPRCARGKVPCLGLGHLTEAQRRAYVLADNKIALNAGWDFEFLRAELLELGHANFDLGLTGFGPGEIEQIMTWAPAGDGRRACHAIELNTAYVDVAIKRWQDFTGKQAVLDGDGRTFNEIAAERGVKDSDEESTAESGGSRKTA